MLGEGCRQPKLGVCVLSYLEKHGNTGWSLGVAFCPIWRDMAIRDRVLEWRFVLSGETWQYGIESRSGVLSYPERHGNRGTGQCLQRSPSFVGRRPAFKRDNSDNPQLPPDRYRQYSADNNHRTGTGGTVQIIFTGQVQAVQYR